MTTYQLSQYSIFHITEVEKQLIRGAPTPQLPNKKQRSGSSSSSKQHLQQSQDDLPLNSSAANNHQTGTTRSTRSHEDRPRGTSMDRLEAGRGGGEDQQSPPQPFFSSFGAASGTGGATLQQRDGVRDDPEASSEAVLSQGPQGILTTKSTVVQLRRNTNKQGRQAPTPPRRTR